MAEQKSGTETSEYTVAQQANFWGVVGLVLGGLVTFGDQIVAALWGKDVTSPAYVIGGACIACASIAYKTLVSLGYIKARSEVKTATTGQETSETRSVAK